MNVNGLYEDISVLYPDLEKITRYTDSITSSPDRCVMEKLKGYLQKQGIPFSEFTVENWKDCFENGCDKTNSFYSDKCRIIKFFKNMGYSQEIQDCLTSLPLSGGTNYILSPDDIWGHIDDVRQETISKYYIAKRECDIYTSLETAVFLLWYGLSIDEIMALKISDISWENNTVLSHSMYDDEFNRRIKRYVEKPGFFYDDVFGKEKFKLYERESCLVMCKGKGTYVKAALIKRIYEMFGYKVSEIYDSGRFYTAYLKYLKGIEPPDVLLHKAKNREQVIDYFEFPTDKKISDLAITILRYDWQRYLDQQKKVKHEK